MILSIDVGTKNLAYTVLRPMVYPESIRHPLGQTSTPQVSMQQNQEPPESPFIQGTYNGKMIKFKCNLMHYKHSDIRGFTASNIKQLFESDKVFLGLKDQIQVVIIEQQFRAPMQQIEYMLHSRLIDYFPEQSIIHQNSKKRLKVNIGDRMKDIKEQQVNDFKLCVAAMNELPTIPKQHIRDISDSYMQAIAYFCENSLLQNVQLTTRSGLDFSVR